MFPLRIGYVFLFIPFNIETLIFHDLSMFLTRLIIDI